MYTAQVVRSAATLLLVLLQNLAVAKRRVVAHQRDGVPLQRLGMLHAEGRDVSRPLLHSLRESAVRTYSSMYST